MYREKQQKITSKEKAVTEVLHYVDLILDYKHDEGDYNLMLTALKNARHNLAEIEKYKAEQKAVREAERIAKKLALKKTRKQMFA
jgi:hypothetical protein